MKEGRYVHVGFHFGKGEPPIGAIEQALESADDWLRYDENCWILYTHSEISVWRERLRGIPGLGQDTTFLLVEFHPRDTSGYMNQWMWDWLYKKRG